MHRLITHAGQAIVAEAPDHWLRLGHRIVVTDGTTITMADTTDNRQAYPQLSAQAPGCGFPIMRVVVLFGLSTGVVFETAMGKHRGKLTAEVSLFREIDHCIEENDVFLADRAYSGWFDLARMMKRGAHSIVRKHQLRKSDISTGIHYESNEHAIQLERPPCPDWMSRESTKLIHRSL